MGLKRRAEFFGSHVGDEAPATLALNQELLGASEKGSCSALVMAGDKIIRAQRILEFVRLFYGHGSETKNRPKAVV
jgi:hypothetical protein